MAAVTAAIPTRRMSTLEQLYLSFFWLSSNALWGAVMIVLVPSQVARMVPDAIKGTAVGAAIGIGSITGLILPPFMGAWSDRVKFQMGRRRPFMLVGTAINLLGLAGMAYFPFLRATPFLFVTVPFWFFVAAYLVTNFSNNFATAPYSALLPDIVPQDQRGTAAGWYGLMTILGNAIGTIVASGASSNASLTEYQGQIYTAYAIIGALLIIGVLVTVLGTHEKPPTTEPKPFRWSEFWGELIEPFKFRDFFWVFFTRLLMTMGFLSIQEFLVLYMTDVVKDFRVFGVVLADSPEAAVRNLLLILLAFAVISTLIAGQLSDKYGRKPLVYISGALMSLVAVGLIFFHQYSASMVIGALFGLGYGAYTSVDWALATDVLPHPNDAAKDMGIWHVALTFPQLVATPIAGLLRDIGQSVGISMSLPTLGYTAVFGVAIIYFILGTVFVARVKKAR